MTEHNLQLVYEELLKDYFPKRRHKIEVSFSGSKALRHTIALEGGMIRFSIAGTLRNAPHEVLKILGLILLARLFRYKVDYKIRRIYNAWVQENVLAQRQRLVRAPSKRYTAKGDYFDLEDVFTRINHLYFGGELPKPVLGWSLKKAYTRLGFYCAERNLLVISRIFDSRKTPPNVLEYLMYHEMLHIRFPVKTINGRRQIHGKEFRKIEQTFPEFKKIQNWIKKKRHRL